MAATASAAGESSTQPDPRQRPTKGVSGDCVGRQWVVPIFGPRRPLSLLDARHDGAATERERREGGRKTGTVHSGRCANRPAIFARCCVLAYLLLLPQHGHPGSDCTGRASDASDISNNGNGHHWPADTSFPPLFPPRASASRQEKKAYRPVSSPARSARSGSRPLRWLAGRSMGRGQCQGARL